MTKTIKRAALATLIAAALAAIVWKLTGTGRLTRPERAAIRELAELLATAQLGGDADERLIKLLGRLREAGYSTHRLHRMVKSLTGRSDIDPGVLAYLESALIKLDDANERQADESDD